jgi:hypothetical protein
MGSTGDLLPKAFGTTRLAEERRDRPVPYDQLPYYREYTNREFGLMPAPDARSLSFPLAVHPSRFVEFLAKPRQVAPMVAKGH